MSPRRLRVEQALDLLPALEELLPLRSALLGASRPDEERAWAASESYATVESRLADPDALEARIPELVAGVARRTEAVYRLVAEAMRGLRAGDAAAAARALISAGEVEEEADRLDAAERYYRKGYELGRRPRDRRAEGLALRRMGRVARSRGELERALRLYRESHEVAEAARDHEGRIVSCQGLGNVHGDLGSWSQAGEWYRRGLELLDPGTPSRLLWQLQSNLSVVARRMGRLDESRRWLREAAGTVDALGDAAGRVFLRNAEGLLCAAAGDLAGAEARYREALSEELPPATRATVLVNLAECLLLQGRVAESERVARELEHVAVGYNVTRLLPHVYRALGAVARERGDPEGFVFFEQALELCHSLNASPMELAMTQHEYGRFDARVGDAGSAAARLRAARELAMELGAAPELERIEADLASLEANLSGVLEESIGE